jgi:hypothetical protein
MQVKNSEVRLHVAELLHCILTALIPVDSAWKYMSQHLHQPSSLFYLDLLAFIPLAFASL